MTTSWKHSVLTSLDKQMFQKQNGKHPSPIWNSQDRDAGVTLILLMHTMKHHQVSPQVNPQHTIPQHTIPQHANPQVNYKFVNYIKLLHFWSNFKLLNYLFNKLIVYFRVFWPFSFFHFSVGDLLTIHMDIVNRLLLTMTDYKRPLWRKWPSRLEQDILLWKRASTFVWPFIFSLWNVHFKPDSAARQESIYIYGFFLMSQNDWTIQCFKWVPSLLQGRVDLYDILEFILSFINRINWLRL